MPSMTGERIGKATVRIGGELVRLLGFDTPETTFGWYRCDAELERGKIAVRRLAEILDSGTTTLNLRSAATATSAVWRGSRLTGAMSEKS